MKKLLFILFVFTFSVPGFSQNFFRENFNHHKKYVILTNPTVNNLKTIQYLVNARLLHINHKVKFVGVYYKGQNYDFSKTRKYIDEKGLKNFYLHEVRGALNVSNIFEDNACTADLKKIFENSVGVFFFGGPDIPPAVYGEKNTRSVVTDANRHLFEATFLYHLLGGYQHENYQPLLEEKPGYLVTGFCLGMQTMNVATGGTLIQDIPAELFGAETPEAALKIGRANLHHNYWKDLNNDTLLMSCNLHTITFTDNPFFGDVVKVPKRWNPRVYSNHHQAIEKLGEGLQVTAVSPDGKIIEGVVHQHFPNVFAVQFHPEVSGLYQNLYVRKFHPEDKPMSYHDIIGKQSVKFHKKYWAHISKVIKRSAPK